MKRSISLLIAIALICVTQSFSFVIDENGTATIDANRCITLDTDAEVYETYVLDISALGVTDREKAKTLFGRIMSNRISFRQLDLTNQTVMMILDLESGGASEWTKQDWVDYFDSRCQ